MQVSEISTGCVCTYNTYWRWTRWRVLHQVSMECLGFEPSGSGVLDRRVRARPSWQVVNQQELPRQGTYTQDALGGRVYQHSGEIGVRVHLREGLNRG